ncbi:hypothetical protein [Stomatohabitans albus]|uniref:hypothetical protein n=1 Tax=Stomatohabitans albus TaxID=3110766 RepID=UPI00300CEF4F
MSDQPNRQPSEQEIMAMIAQLREAPVRDIILQGLGLMVSGAEAKLGRQDARIIIDVVAAVVETAGDQLGDVQSQIETMVAELKTAQVQAEAKLAEAGEQGGDDSATSVSSPSTPPAKEKKQTDKLWIPGK